jgi:hypothetical protein
MRSIGRQKKPATGPGDGHLARQFEYQDPCGGGCPLDNPVRLLLTAGQTSEYTQVEALIEGLEASYVLADKGYDSDAFVSAITEIQAYQ